MADERNASEVFADNVQSLLQDRDLTIQQCADLSGMDRAVMSRLVNKRISPTVRTAETIAGALHVPLSELFKRDFDASKWHVEHAA